MNDTLKQLRTHDLHTALLAEYDRPAADCAATAVEVAGPLPEGGFAVLLKPPADSPLPPVTLGTFRLRSEATALEELVRGLLKLHFGWALRKGWPVRRGTPFAEVDRNWLRHLCESNGFGLREGRTLDVCENCGETALEAVNGLCNWCVWREGQE